MNKREAAARLGVSTKTIERFVKEDKLHPKKVYGATGLQNEFDEAEIEAFAQERATPISETQPVKNGQAQTRQEQTGLILRENAADTLTALAQIIAQNQQPMRPMVAIEAKIFLTIREAAALSGLGVSHLEDAIRRKKLKAQKLAHIRGRRIKRQDLDEYTKKL
jgi:excisionase family DNA binding protein